MADNRKYYYLKLKEDFFDTDEMKILESMKDGYLYSNILLKLYLKSLSNSGRLMYRNVIPYTPEILATLTGHQVGTVEKALDVFKKLDLIEMLDNGAIYMMDIQNFIGQSSSEADRQREYYNRMKAEKEALAGESTETPELPEPKEQVLPAEQKSNKAIGNYTTDFEELWEAYPRKVDKGQAYKKYKARLEDMQDTWTDTISEILSFLTYGWSFHEIVYKRRMGNTKNPTTKSKYTDGLIGWKKLPIRAQETLYRWEYDNEDNLLGMTQMPPPDFGTYTIPMSKALLFRTKSRKNNPEGRSILRNAYRSWYFKRRIQEIEGIGIERDLAGLPVMHGPEGLDLWNDDIEDNKQTRIALENMVKSIRRDEMEGVVLPAGYELELLSSGGTRQFDTNAIINRYDTRIAMTVLADFIFLGHSETGSWALSSDKTELFAMAIGAFLDMICETFNSQGIPPLIDINGEHFAGIRFVL